MKVSSVVNMLAGLCLGSFLFYFDMASDGEFVLGEYLISLLLLVLGITLAIEANNYDLKGD